MIHRLYKRFYVAIRYFYACKQKQSDSLFFCKLYVNILWLFRVIPLKRIAGYNRDAHFLENIAQSTVKRIAEIYLLLLFLALSFFSFLGCRDRA